MRDEFLDTNILVYAFSTDAKADTALDLLARGCMVSVQGLNEFTHVARRKMGMAWPQVLQALADVRALSAGVAPLDLVTHDRGLDLVRRYSLSLYDAFMVAAALQADCRVFYSEDMDNGLVIDGRLRILNPFAGAAIA